MKVKKHIRIPKEKADWVLYACIHFEGSDASDALRDSINKFIKDSLPQIDKQLYKYCLDYKPAGNTLYRALGLLQPNYVALSGNAYLSQILDHYIQKFEYDYPQQALLFRQQNKKEKELTPQAGSDNAEISKPPGKGLISFEDYITYKSNDFIGRKWLFENLNTLIYTDREETFYKSAYLIIHGDPGIGKTAVMAKLAKERRYVHHFNIQTEGVNTASLFLSNICIQLAQKYKLEEGFALAGPSPNSILLQQVLKSVSKQLSKKSKPCIILVDAVDEVDAIPGDVNNILFLPNTLPENIFFILTCREPSLVKLPNNSRIEKLPIIGDSKENMQDAREYLEFVIKKENIRAYLKHHNADPQIFLSILMERSEGNFIYLHHIIREISVGIYSSASLTELPQGLQRYYEEHWRIIKGEDSHKWDYRLPVLATLAVAELPVDINFIRQYSGISKTADIIDAITVWLPFLHKNIDEYSLYHKSFRDFLLQNDQVKGEVLDLNRMRASIASKMKEDLL